MTRPGAPRGRPASASSHGATEPPVVDELDLGPLVEGEPSQLVAGADLEAAAFTDLSLPRLDLSGAVVATSRFTRVTADETDLRDARLLEVELEQVGLAVVRAEGGQWREVRVTGRVGALEAGGARWWSVHLVGCKLGFVNLRDAELLDVAFTDCVVEELDLTGATARRVALSGTRVGSLRTRDSKLHDVDLRRTTLAAIDDITGLAGATVSADQLPLLAPLMAHGLGLRVES